MVDLQCAFCKATLPYNGLEHGLVVRNGIIISEDIFFKYEHPQPACHTSYRALTQLA